MCKPPLDKSTGQYNPTALHKGARIADWLAAITVLVVGILGITGIITMSPAAAYVMVGVGGTSIGLTILNLLVQQRLKCVQKQIRQSHLETV